MKCCICRRPIDESKVYYFCNKCNIYWHKECSNPCLSGLEYSCVMCDNSRSEIRPPLFSVPRTMQPVGSTGNLNQICVELPLRPFQNEFHRAQSEVPYFNLKSHANKKLHRAQSEVPSYFQPQEPAVNRRLRRYLYYPYAGYYDDEPNGIMIREKYQEEYRRFFETFLSFEIMDYYFKKPEIVSVVKELTDALYSEIKTLFSMAEITGLKEYYYDVVKYAGNFRASHKDEIKIKIKVKTKGQIEQNDRPSDDSYIQTMSALYFCSSHAYKKQYSFYADLIKLRAGCQIFGWFINTTKDVQFRETYRDVFSIVKTYETHRYYTDGRGREDIAYEEIRKSENMGKPKSVGIITSNKKIRINKGFRRAPFDEATPQFNSRINPDSLWKRKIERLNQIFVNSISGQSLLFFQFLAYIHIRAPQTYNSVISSLEKIKILFAAEICGIEGGHSLYEVMKGFKIGIYKSGVNFEDVDADLANKHWCKICYSIDNDAINDKMLENAEKKVLNNLKSKPWCCCCC